jgi:hypothetical protein
MLLPPEQMTPLLKAWYLIAKKHYKLEQPYPAGGSWGSAY